MAASHLQLVSTVLRHKGRRRNDRRARQATPQEMSKNAQRQSALQQHSTLVDKACTSSGTANIVAAKIFYGDLTFGEVAVHQL